MNLLRQKIASASSSGKFSCGGRLSTQREKMASNSIAQNKGILSAENCTHVGALAGFKAAAIACVASAIPTLAAVRRMPWAKANLNYTAQALIIGGASTAAFFINSEKAILAGKKRNAGY